jgi:hypothetical protein
MSKEITALLLKKKLDSIKNPKKYLLDCLKRQGLIKEEEITPTITSHDTCQLCNSSDFVSTTHEKICNKCGVVAGVSVNPYATYKQNLNFTRGTFITPGTEIISVIKDGKVVKRDLSKTNTFNSLDPEEKRIKQNIDAINNILDTISDKFNQVVFDRIRKEIVSLWYTIVNVKPDLRGKERLSLMAWSIYYPLVYNNLNINIQRLATVLEIQVGDIYSYNFIIGDIFSGTSYEKYISIPTGIKVTIDLSPEYKNKIREVKKDLKGYLSNPIKTKEEFGIIYYLSKLKNDKKYNLSSLAEKTSISPNIISIEASKIERFYNKNVAKRNRLL